MCTVQVAPQPQCHSVTTSPSRGQIQTSEDVQVTLDLLLLNKEASSSAEYTGGAPPCGQGCGQGCSQPRLPRIQQRSQRKRRYLEAEGGWWVPEFGGSGGTLWPRALALRETRPKVFLLSAVPGGRQRSRQLSKGSCHR